jgi:hypothetical protein
MPVNGVVAKPILGNLKMPGHGSLDLLVVGADPDVEICQRKIEAPSVEPGVKHGNPLNRLGH